MSKLITDEQATGKVRELFDEIKDNFGIVPNFFRAHAVDSD